MAKQELNVKKLGLGDVTLIKPRSFLDLRGQFTELYRDLEFRDVLGGLRIIQENLSVSNPHVIRGMHYQLDRCGKLVRCIQGSIFQVSVDVRKGSETFGHCIVCPLDARDLPAVWVPPGFANGFYAGRDGAVVLYGMTAYYNPDLEEGLAWNDPAVGIPWPVKDAGLLVISQKDKTAKKLHEVRQWSAK